MISLWERWSADGAGSERTAQWPQSRVMGPAVVMGQAIGTASAMSIADGISPRNLNVELLQQELINDGAFLPLP